jgi:sn-glycerol 3-phosphate transport system substrate-binding protein
MGAGAAGRCVALALLWAYALERAILTARRGQEDSGGSAMKRIVLIFFAAALLGLVAACGGGEEKEAEAPSPPAGPVTVTFWHNFTASNIDTLQRLVDRFQASQDEVRVNLVYQGNYDDLLNKLLASFGTGNEPSLAVAGEIATRLMMDSGETVPVQRFVDEDDYDLSDFVARAMEYYTVEGELQCVPLNVSVNLLYYNKVDFQEAGLDPEQPPSTLDEVRADSEKLVTRDGAGNVVRAGIALEIAPWYVENLLVMHGDLYADNANGRDAPASQVLFDNEQMRTLFRWWDDMIDEGLAINVGRNPTGADHFLAVAAGRAAMTIGASGALRSIIDVLEAGEVEGVELGVGPMPGLPDSIAGPPPGDGCFWIMSSRPEAEQRAAWTFLKWLMEPEQQAEWFAGSGYLAIRESAYDLPVAQEAMAKYSGFRVAAESLARGPTEPETLGPVIGAFPQVREALATAAEEMILAAKDPDQALADAAVESNQAIADYNQRLGP